MKSTTIAFLLLLLICAAEIAHVQGRINAGKAKLSLGGRGKRRKRRRRNDDDDDDGKGKEDKEDPKGSFVADQIRKYKCDKNKLKLVLRSARKQGIKVSMTDLLAQFKACMVEKEKAKEKEQGSKEDKEQNEEDDSPPTTLKGLFKDNFEKGWVKENWEEKENLYARVSKSKLDNELGKGMIFDGNAQGKSLKDDGIRKLTTKMFDASGGGTVSFKLKYVGDKGHKGCYTDYTKLKKAEEDKKRAIEQEEKKKAEQAAKKKAEQAAKKKAEQAKKAKANEERSKLNAKRMEEVKARNQCYNNPPCNGHGRGVYKSKCNTKTWECTNRECTCNCIGNWYGASCKKYMGVSQCQSVGDPHPLSLDGLRFNVYDAGEFLMFKHPEHTAEIHMLTRMAHPRISATAGIAIKNKDTTIILEQPHCANRNNFQVRALEGSRCRNIGWGRRYRRDGLYYNGGRHIYGPKGIDIYIGGWWRYGWWRGRCGSAYWLNIYIRVKAPRDGRAQGLCGSFAGNRNKDERELIAQGGRRPHHQISRNTRNKWMIPASESFFKCGMWNPGFRYSPYRFQQLAANAKGKVSAKQMQSAAAMVDAESKLAKEFAMDRALNEANDKKKGENDEALPRAKALALCKKKKDIDTEEALTNCVNDLSMTNDKKVENVAAAESEEEAENAVAEIKEDEKDEEIEIVAEAKMKKADKMDLILQWCGRDCHNEKNWKQLKAYPQKVYGDFLSKWRTMTARLPKEAMTPTLRLRFYQKEHTCYCCNAYAIDDFEVIQGGMNVAIVADKAFELYADGNLVGEGEWWEPAKDTYRFKVESHVKTFAVKINGGNDAKMGLLGMFGDKLVTSSSWKCSATNTDENWKNKNFDDSGWGSAAEEGRNGILPWGERPGIAKQAYWIFTHDVYKMRGQTAYCRVNVADAAHSHARTHVASRWSCKNGKNRLSPAALQLDSNMVSAVEVRNGKEADEHFSPGTSFTTKVEDDDEARVLMKLKTKSFIDKTIEGATIKRSVLRLLVADESENEIIVCKLIRKWSAGDVTWNSQPAYDGPKDKCVTAKAEKKNEWIDLDISDWVREWVSDPAKNFGMVFMPTGKDSASFISHLDPDANQRPRLTMSCHGDRTDSSHVFKATKAFLHKTDVRTSSTGPSGATGATGSHLHVMTGIEKPEVVSEKKLEEIHNETKGKEYHGFNHTVLKHKIVTHLERHDEMAGTK